MNRTLAEKKSMNDSKNLERRTAMKPPISIEEGIRNIHTLLNCIMTDVDNYLERPSDYAPEYFRSVSGAAADAHMLMTWVKDQLGMTPK